MYSEQADIGTAIRRRGILAAAGAVVAGIVAKQAAQPVAAVVTDTNFVATGSGIGGVDFDARGTADMGVDTRNGNFFYGVYGKGTLYGVYGTSTSFTGVGGEATGPGTGVSGVGVGGSGVVGSSMTNNGISGSTGAVLNSGRAGIFGTGSAAGTFGIVGDGNGVGSGVQGQNGQYGVVGKVTNVADTVAVYGDNQSATGNNNIGVYGTSNSGYGILGVSNKAGFSGVTGAAYTAGVAAFAGGTSTPGAYAAYFTGQVNIDGSLFVNGTQRFTLKHTDGSQRLASAIQSPEAWVEDFGTGILAGGRADVALDADFAAIAETGDYFVFLTPGDGAGALRFARRTGAGFAVEEIGAASNGSFAWRVVARPKAAEKGVRLARYTPPGIRIPGIVELPKSLPDAPTPEKPKEPSAPTAPLPQPRVASSPAITVTPAAAQSAASTATVAPPTAAPSAPQPAPPSRP